MEANDYYLNQYLNQLDEEDAADTWKEQQVKYLMSEGQDFYPWTNDNVMEALCNLAGGAEIFFTSQVIVAAKNLKNSTSQECLSIATIRVIEEYWTEAAKKRADIDFSELENDHNED